MCQIIVSFFELILLGLRFKISTYCSSCSQHVIHFRILFTNLYETGFYWRGAKNDNNDKFETLTHKQYDVCQALMATEIATTLTSLTVYGALKMTQVMFSSLQGVKRNV